MGKWSYHFSAEVTSVDHRHHVVMASWNVVHVVGTGRDDWWIKTFVR